jgi:hypothetical protein
MSPRGSRLLLFGFEVALAVGYIVALAYFVFHSLDFVVERNNARAYEAARTREPALPAHFSFVAPSADVALLGAGWYRGNRGTVEAAGPLSKSPAYVYIPVPANRAATVTLLVKPFLAPGHEVVTIDAWIDGVPFGPWTARLGEPPPSISMPAPAAATSDGLLEIRLDVNDEAAPSHFVSGSRDKRPLGLRLLAITLDAGLTAND